LPRKRCPKSPVNAWPHDACFDPAGNIFVAEWVHTGRITKLRKVS
jgi:hypothetical protein